MRPSRDFSFWPPRRMVPRGRNKPASTPEASRARRRLLVRVLKSSSSTSVAGSSPSWRASISSTAGAASGMTKSSNISLLIGMMRPGFGQNRK